MSVSRETAFAVNPDIIAHHANHVATFETVGCQLESAVNDEFDVVANYEASATLFFDSKEIGPLGNDKRSIFDFSPVE